MKRIKITRQIQEENTNSFESLFEKFMKSKLAKGVEEVSVKHYQSTLNAISKRYENFWQLTIEDFSLEVYEDIVAVLRGSGISRNTIHTYTVALKAFIMWCRERKLTDVVITPYTAEETVKETYTNGELAILLKKPDMKTCSFSEFRNWVIINLLVNNGVRSGTVRAIRYGDVDFDNRLIYCRHTKNKKALTIPMSSALIPILKEYMAVREGAGEDDFLFCDCNGNELSENALKLAIKKYNLARGIEKTSVHAFRHTFARNYLVECGGDALMLQRLLGHSTLEMTKHYCRIYDTDLTEHFDDFSPLQKIQEENKAAAPKAKEKKTAFIHMR